MYAKVKEDERTETQTQPQHQQVVKENKNNAQELHKLQATSQNNKHTPTRTHSEPTTSNNMNLDNDIFSALYISRRLFVKPVSNVPRPE